MAYVIRELRDISRADTGQVGAKAAALGALERAGFPSVPGIVLTTLAYEIEIARLAARLETRLPAEVIDDPGELEPAAAEIRDWIRDATWSEPLADALRSSLARYGGQPASFAARTSLPVEDLATAFGAGVTRAVLGLCGEDKIRRGVAACWAALWTSRSIYYRYRKKIPQTGVALAVVVQPMIRADSAGAMFTQNRATGDASEVEIESIWGLGEQIARARVRPDRFFASKVDGRTREQEIQEKSVRLAIGADGSMEQQAVPEESIGAPSLSTNQVRELVRLGAAVEDLFGSPQDIEWASVGDKLFILQARPIALRQS